MGLTPGEIQALLELFEASTWQEMTVDLGDDHLHVSRRTNGSASTPVPPAVAAPAPASPPPAPAVTPAAGGGNGAAAGEPGPQRSEPPLPAPGSAAGVAVSAPSVGLFWRSPAPGAAPFVEVGSRVAPDDTIAIIEVMKLMSPLKAGLSGVVTAILAANGATVARGDALVLVDPDA
jgi:acetyl-CoA carboxylase biotin carboxyl carrier protein